MSSKILSKSSLTRCCSRQATKSILFTITLYFSAVNFFFSTTFFLFSFDFLFFSIKIMDFSLKLHFLFYVTTFFSRDIFITFLFGFLTMDTSLSKVLLGFLGVLCTTTTSFTVLLGSSFTSSLTS